MKDFTGIHSPYEVPGAAEAIANTAEQSQQDVIDKLMKLL
ncbi:hypothetical protein [Franzmannia qiaohouensis]